MSSRIQAYRFPPGLWIKGIARTLFARREWQRRAQGGMLGFVGFMLSPLSWWNDLFVNVPLALAFAWLISLVCPAVFKASFILGYWLTNVLGLVLMQKSGQMILSGKKLQYPPKSLLIAILISLGYTAITWALVHFGIIKPLPDYQP